MINLSVVKVVLLSVVLFALPGAAEAEVIEFDTSRWEYIGETTKVEEHLGRNSLTGMALLKEIEFGNGIIEVDVACAGGREFAGIAFRIKPGLLNSDRNYSDFEQLYLRPHKSGLPDALQYTPVFNGQTCWQLYSGAGFIAEAVIPDNRWFHLKIEISGTQARVFLDNANEPSLVINEFQQGDSKGAIAIYGSYPGQTHFSNFSFESNDNLRFDSPSGPTEAPGALTRWQISQVFSADSIDNEQSPTAQNLSGIEWQDVLGEPSGLVNISRHRLLKGKSCVLAKTIIHSDSVRIKKLDFGYSDKVSIFLNGRILFTGDSSFRSRDPLFLGVAGLNDAVYLPLQKGDNELLLMVSESMGGWGFISRLTDQ
jgi:hypothetical protein